MSAAPGTPRSVLIAAIAFLAIGTAIAAWPRPLIQSYIGLIKPMRGLTGRALVDWEIGLLEGWAAPLVVRLFGLFVILAGASILYFRATRQPTE